MAKEYHYSVDLGAPWEYSVLYDFDENYLTDKKGKPLLRFAFTGGSPGASWGMGTQATSLSEYHPLPHGIKLRWFSVVENQFWEGEYEFHRPFLERLMNYKVNNLLYRTHDAFAEYFVFTVNVVPGGLATVWIDSQGEQFLLAQFQAQKVEESNWDRFTRRVIQLKKTYTQEEFVQSRLERPQMKEAKKSLLAGKVPTSEYWQKLMTPYFWELTVNDAFTLKDYLATYLNGEQYYTYVTDNQLAKARAVPFEMVMYFEDKKKELHRLDLYFDQEEIKKGFAKMAAIEPTYEPINFHLKIREDIKEITAFLIKGETQIEIHNITADYPKLYNH